MTTPSITSTDTDSVVKDFTANLVYFSNEFPSDDLLTLFGSLQRHGRDSKFPFLSIFLTECIEMLKREVTLLPRSLGETLPPFQNIVALAIHSVNNRQGPLASALDGALLCALQVGMLIGHHEAHNIPYNLHRDNTKLAGLAMGLLSAAAVSVAESLADLCNAGVESARLAFRLNVHVDRASQLLESRNDDEPPESWAYVVTGISEDEIQTELDIYNSSTSSPEITKIYISTSDSYSVGVTGPPTRLKNAFLSSQKLRYSTHLPLPVFGGLCHGSHLYTSEDVKAIVHGSEAARKPPHMVRLRLYSTRHGEPFRAKTARELFEEIVLEILTGKIYLDKMTAGLISSLSMSSECRFIQFRSSIISRRLVSSIESELHELPLVKEDLVDWSTKNTVGHNSSSTKNSKLAIIGMSCRLPGGANNSELFWKLLVDGRDVHTTVPKDRFDLEAHLDPTGATPNTTETPYGNFIDNPGFFDAGFFNMSPREAEQTDPMHRLALVTAYEALEMAGYSPNRTPSTNVKRIGTFYGQASDDWREVNGGQNIGTYAVPGGERSFANGRINYFFKFGGPSFNVDTACSSGLAAVNAACSALWAGEADTVLTGGLNVITNPDNYCMLCKGHFLSKTGQCKVWDKGADGYCRAEGIGAVVIKRLEDAEADNDNVLAVIAAGFTNHSAEALSITQPHAGAQMDNYTQVMSAAGVSPLDVSYIELHGTGTQVGDAVESESIAGTFALPGHRRRADQRLHLGAVKSNVGHSEAAAGITSLLKVLLIFQKNQIPPHIGIKTEVNPVVLKNLDRRNAGLVSENIPWPRPEGRRRYALVNSFGAHGGNTTLLLEDAPERLRIGEDPRSTHVFTLSAKSKNSLRANTEALIQYLDKNPDTGLGDLSYTLCARRMHHQTRFATSASSVSQLQKFLESSLERINDVRGVPITPPSVVMTFTGQGAFYDGISSQLYQNFPVYRSEIQHLDTLVQKLGIPSIIPYIENPVTDNPVGEPSPLMTQLIIIVVEIALTRFWQSFGVVPSAVIGHSLGEYAAMVAAGIISAADAIFLVAKRAMLMTEHCTPGSHVMLSVRASVDALQECIGTTPAHSYEISCRNGIEDTVITGKRNDIDSIRVTLEEKGLKTMLLNLPYAFHSAQLDPVLPKFEEVSRCITFKEPNIPLISPLLEDCVFDGKTINARYLSQASRQPVLFLGALKVARETGIVDDKTVWIDVGPHPVCSGFVRNWAPNANAYPSLRRDEDNFATLAGTLAGLHAHGIPISWNEYYRPYEKALRLLDLQSYIWNEKNYWIQYEGSWTIDKAFPERQKHAENSALAFAESSLRTSSIHQIISEEVYDSSTKARLTAMSDLRHPSLLPAVTGHMMNGYGVVTTSIWGDMALTVGEHLYKLLSPSTKEVYMNVADVEVSEAQVISNNGKEPHLIKITAELDLSTNATSVQWHQISPRPTTEEHFASCVIRYEDPSTWQREWDRIAHFVAGRADELTRLATRGEATRVDRKMAYTLFCNVVDYADKYRGMHSVILSDFEGLAEVTLAPETHGVWHSAPHFIDSVFHIGGLVLNSGGVVDARESFYVTHGWGSCRLLKRLQPGDRYKCYVRMPPTEEANMFEGDVYVLQDGAVVGMMGEMRFRRVPRLLMNHFFSPADSGKKANKAQKVQKPAASASRPQQPPVPTSKVAAKPEPVIGSESPLVQQTKEEQLQKPVTTAAREAAPVDPHPENPVIADSLQLISRETGLDINSLTDEASFVELGIDSLMSLVLSEKFRIELQLDVKSSVFLDCPNIGALKEWLNEYCC